MRILILSMLFLAGAASAQVTTYTYTGQELVNGTWGPTSSGGTPPAASTPVNLSGTVTLSAPLNPNQANQMVQPVSWSFGAPTWSITSAFLAPLSGQTNPSLNASFVFSTVNGQITAWAWSISWNYGYDGAVMGSGTITSVGSEGLGSDSWIGSPESGVSHCGFSYACDGFSAYVMQPGAWVTPAAALPAPAPAPAPAPPAPAVTTPANVGVLYCVNRSNVFKVLPASNSTSSLVRSPTGTGQTCADPSGISPSWYIQITKDGGSTWSWVTLASLGLGN